MLSEESTFKCLSLESKFLCCKAAWEKGMEWISVLNVCHLSQACCLLCHPIKWLLGHSLEGVLDNTKPNLFKSLKQKKKKNHLPFANSTQISPPWLFNVVLGFRKWLEFTKSMRMQESLMPWSLRKSLLRRSSYRSG